MTKDNCFKVVWGGDSVLINLDAVARVAFKGMEPDSGCGFAEVWFVNGAFLSLSGSEAWLLQRRLEERTKG